MPTRPKKTCQYPRCPNLTDTRYCKIHVSHIRALRKPSNQISARKRGYTKTWEKYARAFIKRNPICVICGAPSKICDHIMPYKQMLVLYGGNTYNDNDYQALCVGCNTRKGKEENENK